MAYTPISQTKKTGGYVPIGQPTKTPQPAIAEYQSFFPNKTRVAISSYNIKQKEAAGMSVKELAEKISDKPATISQGKKTLIEKARDILPKHLGEGLFGTGEEVRAGQTIIPGIKAPQTKSDAGLTGFLYENWLKTDQRYYDELRQSLIDSGVQPNRASEVAGGQVADLTDKEQSVITKKKVISNLMKGLELLDFAPAVKPTARIATQASKKVGAEVADNIRLIKEIQSSPALRQAGAIGDDVPSLFPSKKLKAAEVVPTAPIVKQVDELVPSAKITTPARVVQQAVSRGDKVAPVIKKIDDANIPVNATASRVPPTQPIKVSEIGTPLTKAPKNLSFIPDYVVQVAEKTGDGVRVFRIPKEDFSEVKKLIDEGRTKDTPIAMGLEMEDGIFHITAKTPETMLSKPNVIDGGFITAKQLGQISKEGVVRQNLPPLPKLPPEIRSGLESRQADATITKAVRERYSQAARRPVREDSALAKAAKKPGNIEGVKKLAGELLTPISSRLMRINPILKRELRAFEFRVAANTTRDSQEILPLLQSVKKMSKDDQAIFDLARKNGDSEVIDALATKYDLHDELNRVRDVLDDLHERAGEVGMDIQYRKDYFPRMVTNPEKFMAYLRGTEDWGLIQRMLDNAAKAKGLKVTDLTPEEQVAMVNNLIRGYGDKVTLAKSGFSQPRTIQVIDDKLNEFYETSDSALSAYVVRMNDEIEARRFFGKHSKTPIGDARIEDSIGSYVLDLAAKGDIKPDQIDEVLDIFKSRFHRGKMNGALDVYRNAEYISTMGSPISAITQIGDLAFSVYENGFYHTLKGMSKSLLSKNKLSKEALGIENVTQEFTKDTMSGRALDKVFRLVGLEKMDRLGKETLVNSYLSKLKSQARANDAVLKRELDFMFDADEANLAMKELAEGKLTERTKLLAFNKLLDFQPVAKSEMPQKYLEMPNGRIFYMLKSFTLKQYDVFRREAIDGIVSGDKKRAAQGIKNLVLLSGAFVAANATADEIKDLILGRETPPSDKVIDNLWRLVGASKYDVYKARTDGVGQTVVKKILFPTSLADRAYKDVTNQLEGKAYEKGPLKGEEYKLESTQSIPVGGKLYYWWMGRGAQKEEYKDGDTATSSVPSLPELPELPKLPKLPKL